MIIPQAFPDVGNPFSSHSDFHRVFQIKYGIQLPIYRDVKESGIKRMEQMIDDRIVKKMIAHGEKKRCGDAIGRCEQRNAILLLPIVIFNEGHTNAGGYQLLDARDHALAFIANDEAKSLY